LSWPCRTSLSSLAQFRNQDLLAAQTAPGSPAGLTAVPFTERRPLSDGPIL
jgi:hypothetical protein